jgi:hypothetical protein
MAPEEAYNSTYLRRKCFSITRDETADIADLLPFNFSKSDGD